MKLAVLASLGLVALLAPSRGEAASFDVSPVRVELGARDPSTLVVIRNAEGGPLRLQLRLHTWSESPAGEMILGEAADLSAFPGLLQLGPGESRKIRVGTTARPGAAERAWRLFVEELPGAVAAAEKSSVQVLTRVGIPVFLAPTVARVEGRLAVSRKGSKLEVVIRNEGTVHLEPMGVSLRYLDGAGKQIDAAELKAWYVLAGGERRFAVDPAAATCAAVRKVVANAVLEGGTLAAELALPSGACAP